MKTIPLVLALLLAAVASPLAAAPAEKKAGASATVRAILITATNLKREADPKLAAFEAELQRNIPLSSFRYVNEGSTAITSGKPAAIVFKGGHRLQIEGEKSGGSVHVKVVWTNGKDVIMNVSLTLQPGVPAVLGRRPSGDGEAPIILVIPN